MTFNPLLEDITSISDEEINLRLSDLRGRLVKAHGMGMQPYVTDQLQAIANSLQDEQQRRALVRMLEQQAQPEE